MKATWNNTVIAEAQQDELVRIEGNWYFPPRSLKWEFFQENSLRTICHWKGEASYYDVVVNGDINEACAWYYPSPKDGSVERVKKDFRNFAAFWHGVEVVDE